MTGKDEESQVENVVPDIHTTVSPEINYDQKKKTSTEINHLEQVISPDLDKKDHMNYDRVDKEVAQYVNDVGIVITPEENSRLKHMIDKRVLSIMIFTYFLQALDKGTMSFASIMKIQTDTHLHGQQVRIKCTLWEFICLFRNSSRG
jgi:hypothetical protein